MLLAQLPSFQVQDFISFVVVGMLAAFLVGYLMKGRGFGWLGNLVIGIIGAIVGPFLYGLLRSDLLHLRSLPKVTIGVGDVVLAMIGAFVLLLVVGFVKKRDSRDSK